MSLLVTTRLVKALLCLTAILTNSDINTTECKELNKLFVKINIGIIFQDFDSSCLILEDDQPRGLVVTASDY